MKYNNGNGTAQQFKFDIYIFEYRCVKIDFNVHLDRT